MSSKLSTAFLLALAIVSPVMAHAPDSRSAPLEGLTLRLEHRSPQELIALFSRATLPDGAHTPRSARAETAESLLPTGIDAILRGENGAVNLVGARDRCREFEELLRRLDREWMPLPDGQFETRVRTAGPVRDVARTIRTLAGGGQVALEGSELRLTGTREWLFRALRVVIEAETKPTPPSGERKL